MFLKPFTTRNLSSFETYHIVYRYTCKGVVTGFLNTVCAILDPMFSEVCIVFIPTRPFCCVFIEFNGVGFTVLRLSSL